VLLSAADPGHTNRCAHFRGSGHASSVSGRSAVHDGPALTPGVEAPRSAPTSARLASMAWVASTSSAACSVATSGCRPRLPEHFRPGCRPPPSAPRGASSRLFGPQHLTVCYVTVSNKTKFDPTVSVFIYTQGQASYSNNSGMTGQILACGGFTNSNLDSITFDPTAADGLVWTPSPGSVPVVTVTSKLLLVSG
jgi:hypothetical protein